MSEPWIAVIFAVVIVGGMVTARVWTAFVSEGLPLLRDWIRNEQGGPDRLDGAFREVPRDPEVARRMRELEEEVEFLESLLEERQGPSASVTRTSPAWTQSAARDAP